MSRRWRWLQAMLASIFRRRAVDAEIRAELEEHMERRAEALVAQGVEPEAARRRAVAEFGSAPRYEEESREAYGARWLEAGWQDLRLAVRGWRKAPGLGALIVLVLALGLGAATAVFTLVDAALLASWPFPHSDQVMFLARLPPPKVNLGYSVLQWGRTDYLQFARHQHAFSEVAAFQPATYTLTGHGEPLQLDAYQVSASFFTTLGARPQLGCWFTPAEDKIGASGAVVISDQLWRQQLGANPRVVGTVLDLSGKSYTVVGVMPAGFAFPRGPVMPPVYTAPVRPEFWVPMALPQGGPIKNEPQTLAVIGRLAPGFTRARADADLAVFARRMETAYPRAKGWFSTRAVPITEQASGAVRTPLLLMLAAVGLVFLLACINIAGVLLARGLTRSQEFAVRLALGADRLRLARQLLIEVLPLALGGGALGLGLGSAGVNLVRHFGPVGLPHLTAAALDSRVVLFALTMTLLAAVLCALAPAWQAARHTAGLRAGARDLPSGGSAKARRALLTAQVAMAVMVVIGAGLLLRSLRHLLAVPTGIRPEGVLTFAITLPDTYNQPGKTEAFYRAVLGRLRAIPGVTAAGIAETLPVDGATNGTTIRMPGRTYRRRPNANYTFITPGYFAAIGATLLRGRDFTASDTARSPVVVIISEAMARMYWPARPCAGPTGRSRRPGLPDGRHRRRGGGHQACGAGGSSVPGDVRGLQPAPVALDADAAVCRAQPRKSDHHGGAGAPGDPHARPRTRHRQCGAADAVGERRFHGPALYAMGDERLRAVCTAAGGARHLRRGRAGGAAAHAGVRPAAGAGRAAPGDCVGGAGAGGAARRRRANSWPAGGVCRFAGSGQRSVRGQSRRSGDVCRGRGAAGRGDGRGLPGAGPPRGTPRPAPASARRVAGS